MKKLGFLMLLLAMATGCSHAEKADPSRAVASDKQKSFEEQDSPNCPGTVFQSDNDDQNCPKHFDRMRPFYKGM